MMNDHCDTMLKRAESDVNRRIGTSRAVPAAETWATAPGWGTYEAMRTGAAVMAKDLYKIPTSIDRSYLDHEIVLASNGWQAPPVAVRQIGFWLASVLVLMWSMTSTFLGDAGFGLGVLVVIWWLAATVFLGRMTRTRELRYRTVLTFLAYAPKAARTVLTRRGNDPSEFGSIVAIDGIDPDGAIWFADGGCGRVYLVVGSASILLFEEDRAAILNRVDAFWRKVEPTAEYCFITTKEPQRIHHQMANLERRNLALTHRDPDLVELMDEQADILTTHVGGQFNSIHQYLLIRGQNREALRRAHNLLTAEVESSPLMIKECTMLNRDEAIHMLRVLYRGTSDNPPIPSSPWQPSLNSTSTSTQAGGTSP